MKDYDARLALVQEGDFKYSIEDSAKILFPTLKNCAYEFTKPLSLEKYKTNSIGYRNEEFDKDPAYILAAGCSQTWGTGILDDLTWPRVLSKTTGMSVDNVGYFGKSTAGIVQIVFAYFREVGHPRYVYLLLPDLYRMILPASRGLMHSKKYSKEKQDMISNTSIGDTVVSSEKPKYFTVPYYMEEVMTQEFTIWQAMSSLQILEDYCSNLNIGLKYGTWETNTEGFFRALPKDNNFYNNYVDLESDMWSIHNIENGKEYYMNDPYCHIDFKNETNEMYWERASDFDTVNKNAHIGAHRHIHIAEAFAKELRADQRNLSND